MFPLVSGCRVSFGDGRNVTHLKVKNSPWPILVALSMGEMALKHQLEFDGTRYYGRVDMGSKMNNEQFKYS